MALSDYVPPPSSPPAQMGESLPTGSFLAASAPGGVDFYNAQLKGMSVAGFQSNEYFGFVVSDLGGDAMLKIATALAPPLRNALDGSVGSAQANACFPGQPALMIEKRWKRDDLRAVAFVQLQGSHKIIGGAESPFPAFQRRDNCIISAWGSKNIDLKGALNG